MKTIEPRCRLLCRLFATAGARSLSAEKCWWCKWCRDLHDVFLFTLYAYLYAYLCVSLCNTESVYHPCIYLCALCILCMLPVYALCAFSLCISGVGWFFKSFRSSVTSLIALLTRPVSLRYTLRMILFEWYSPKVTIQKIQSKRYFLLFAFSYSNAKTPLLPGKHLAAACGLWDPAEKFQGTLLTGSLCESPRWMAYWDLQENGHDMQCYADFD